VAKLVDNFEQARKCLAILSFCAETDQIAQRFHDTLSTSFDSVSQIDRSMSPDQAPETQFTVAEPMWSPLLGNTENVSGYFSLQETDDSPLKEHASKLLIIICRPFADAEELPSI
jgi:hypothetical protein